MTTAKTLIPSQYAKDRYNITKPIDFDVGIFYSSVVLAIAGADGELADEELAWFFNEQHLFLEDSKEYLDALRKVDWKSINIEEALSNIHYDFTINFRHTMLYQAIKMSKADKVYHEKEKAAVDKAAKLLGVNADIVASIESLVKFEETTDELRLALVGSSSD